MSLDKDNLQGQGMTSLRTRQRLIERLTEKGISDVRVLVIVWTAIGASPPIGKLPTLI